MSILSNSSMLCIGNKNALTSIIGINHENNLASLFY